jgi:stage II sporulation protein D
VRAPVLLVAASLAVTIASARVGTGSAEPVQAVPGEAVFVLSGRGWGHGVGMSQYGAYGMANEGTSYDEILSYYYSGTELGRTGTDEVRVLLAEGRRAVTVSSGAVFRIVDAAGTVTKMPAAPLVLKADLMLPTPGGPAPAIGPVSVRAGKAPLSVDGRLYRGRFDIAVQGSFLRVVNTLPIESYLQGVVAGEMPHTWPLEALKAQAVAARSYALANLVKGKPFDLYSDQRSQVYTGLAGERSRTSDAVRATAGRVVLYGGKVASTLYFSSSGGKTASSVDVFGVTVPYLVSKPDPWDKASPYHRWGPVPVGARTLQAKLGLQARVLDATGTPTPSGRLRAVTLQTTVDSSSVPASLLRTTLGLRSTWFTIGVLRLDRPSGPVVFGSTLRLTGVARGLESPALASSADGSAWIHVRTLTRGSGGSVSIAVRPTRTTRYRLESKGAACPGLLVRVAPRVRLGAPVDPGALSGTVRPRLTGAPVSIERRQGTAWIPVADTVVDPTGSFRVELQVVPGSYRARVAATEGFAEGVTPVLTVSA